MSVVCIRQAAPDPSKREDENEKCRYGLPHGPCLESAARNNTATDCACQVDVQRSPRIAVMDVAVEREVARLVGMRPWLAVSPSRNQPVQ
jgi:hypothetical protein